MVKLITIYVEGGGETRKLQEGCREGFRTFLEKLNIKHRFKIVACGSRTNAYDSFCLKLKNIKNDEHCLLLVDSETQITNSSVWQHVLLREDDKWQKPEKSTEEHLHFMVECMEAWFMADKKALAEFYGQKFNQNALPKHNNIEAISKQDLESALKNATRDTSKGKYSKGNHSFDILSKIDANKVVAQSPYANRLYKTLQELQNPK